MKTVLKQHIYLVCSILFKCLILKKKSWSNTKTLMVRGISNTIICNLSNPILEWKASNQFKYIKLYWLFEALKQYFSKTNN